MYYKYINICTFIYMDHIYLYGCTNKKAYTNTHKSISKRFSIKKSILN